MAPFGFTWAWLKVPRFAALLAHAPYILKSTMSSESLVLKIRAAAAKKAAATAAADGGAGAQAGGPATASGAASASGAATDTGKKRKTGACTVCKQLGHNRNNKRKCPGPPAT